MKPHFMERMKRGSLSSDRLLPVDPQKLLVWIAAHRDNPLQDVPSIQQTLVNHVYSTLARTPHNMDDFGAYQASAYSLRDLLVRRWIRTQETFTRRDPKRVYYLSLEYLVGRSFQNALFNLELQGKFVEALKGLGYELEDLYDEEQDAALGNGGLGRLAACFMDSMATLDYPACGYGLRYTYGIFEQRIVDGEQKEVPDFWLHFGNPWEIQRLDVTFNVEFYGHITASEFVEDEEEARVSKHIWTPGETIIAVAYDVPVPGYQTANTIHMRLWSSKPSKIFDLDTFNKGDYEAAVRERQHAENITSVLYPNDSTYAGKELRLRQQYFFVSATLQDIIRRFKKTQRGWEEFPNQVSIQLNDTHPTLGIVELQRLLIDIEGLKWNEGWDIVTRTFCYTNHTVLPEALERWPVNMISQLLPRHMKIIYDLNLFFLRLVEKRWPGDRDRLRRMSIIEEGNEKMVRMAYLAVVGSHTVNGVAAIHSNIVKSELFRDFAEFFGESKFQNKTNGITPRRWLALANPKLKDVITDKIGSQWLTDLTQLRKLADFVDDEQFRRDWAQVKQSNKDRLADYITAVLGVQVDAYALFDIQVKRIHEYKRQLLNILWVIYRYIQILAEPEADIQPRVVIFGGKAAPGYMKAKDIIRFINAVANVINNDPAVGDKLKVVFIPNYSVSLAELIIPASDISQHISTAGTEASGTSNMKFVLNGGLILGTMDGANIEIMEEIGKENIFIFGAKADEVEELRHSMRYHGSAVSPQLVKVLSLIRKGTFGPADHWGSILDTFAPGNDVYLVATDFLPYLEAQKAVDAAYRDKNSWIRKSILSSSGMGKFSSDRTIREYAEQIWNIKPCHVATPDSKDEE